jgi:hypothetical protein
LWRDLARTLSSSFRSSLPISLGCPNTYFTTSRPFLSIDANSEGFNSGNDCREHNIHHIVLGRCAGDVCELSLYGGQM